MGYYVEISINMIKHPNISQLKREITDIAIELNCDHYYYLYEVENKNRIPRNHIVIVINFDDSQIFNCAHFLKLIKKMKNLHIECIYDDEIACNLLYASKYYLSTVEKDKVIKYNKNKRERSLSDNEKTILEPITNSNKN